jgi:Beta-ketoacyl synthase, N-terminal domain
MFYIHKPTCISPQQTFSIPDIDHLNPVTDNKMKALEPAYDAIPTGMLRRMGKAVRMGVGAALPIIREKTQGIIIGTANGGMEDCIKFLNQIIEYEEGVLTPGNFVQSTTNAIAGQMGLMNANKGYNITHVHRALAFENAILDADMLLKENPGGSFLLGGVDEISTYNYNIEYLGNWYKNRPANNQSLYSVNSPGTIAGEGSAMFLVNGMARGAAARLDAVHTLHSQNENAVATAFSNFLDSQVTEPSMIDGLITGENGDSRLLKYYEACESIINPRTSVLRFKHMTGEYPTASAVAVWLACYILQQLPIPAHLFKKRSVENNYRKIVIYNNYKGLQHSFLLLSRSSAE